MTEDTEDHIFVIISNLPLASELLLIMNLSLMQHSEEGQLNYSIC